MEIKEFVERNGKRAFEELVEPLLESGYYLFPKVDPCGFADGAIQKELLQIVGLPKDLLSKGLKLVKAHLEGPDLEREIISAVREKYPRYYPMRLGA